MFYQRRSFLHIRLRSHLSSCVELPEALQILLSPKLLSFACIATGALFGEHADTSVVLLSRDLAAWKTSSTNVDMEALHLKAYERNN